MNPEINFEDKRSAQQNEYTMLLKELENALIKERETNPVYKTQWDNQTTIEENERMEQMEESSIEWHAKELQTLKEIDKMNKINKMGIKGSDQPIEAQAKNMTELETRKRYTGQDPVKFMIDIAWSRIKKSGYRSVVINLPDIFYMLKILTEGYDEEGKTFIDRKLNGITHHYNKYKSQTNVADKTSDNHISTGCSLWIKNTLSEKSCSIRNKMTRENISVNQLDCNNTKGPQNWLRDKTKNNQIEMNVHESTNAVILSYYLCKLDWKQAYIGNKMDFVTLDNEVVRLDSFNISIENDVSKSWRLIGYLNHDLFESISIPCKNFDMSCCIFMIKENTLENLFLLNRYILENSKDIGTGHTSIDKTSYRGINIPKFDKTYEFSLLEHFEDIVNKHSITEFSETPSRVSEMYQCNRLTMNKSSISIKSFTSTHLVPKGGYAGKELNINKAYYIILMNKTTKTIHNISCHSHNRQI